VLHMTKVERTGPHVLVVHYHKTGWEVTHDLATVLNEMGDSRPFTLAVDLHGKREHSVDGCMSVTFNGSFVQQLEAPDFLCDDLSDKLPADMRLVHFVREPLSMIVSGYTYHAQQPPPETWLNETGFDPCAYDRWTMAKFFATLGLTEEHLEAVHELCIKHRGPFAGGQTYSELLNTLDDHDGILVEAARSLLNSHIDAGADVTRMGVNSLRLASWPGLKLTLSQFWNDTRASIEQFANFAAPPVPEIDWFEMDSEKSSGVSPSPVPQYVSADSITYMTKRFTEVQNGPEDWRKFHQTSHKVSDHQRSRLVKYMEESDVLSPVIRRVRGSVCDGAWHEGGC
jgi:hypothetical protein